MANMKFNVRVYIENPAYLPELQARMQDMSPAFSAIYERWVAVNEQKFEQARGGEVGGAQIFEEFWAGLTPAYLKEKHPKGAPKRKRASGEYPDWLLVKSGALMQAMTDPEALFHDLGPRSATFGTPEDPGLADIVAWQSGPQQKHRQVVFLAEPDINSIRMNIQDYLGMGGEFRDIRFAKGLASQSLQGEAEDLDAGFGDEAFE